MAVTCRIRLERAVYLMAHRDRPRLTDVALAVGFSSSSAFSRAFRQRFGVPPREFDVAAFRRDGLGRLVDTLPDPDLLAHLPEPGDADRFAVGLRDLPPRRIAYLRVFRPYEGDGVRSALTRLMAWAEARGLAGGQWLGYQWDDPTIVPLEQCRYDVGLEVPATPAAGPPVGSGAVAA